MPIKHEQPPPPPPPPQPNVATSQKYLERKRQNSLVVSRWHTTVSWDVNQRLTNPAQFHLLSFTFCQKALLNTDHKSI